MPLDQHRASALDAVDELARGAVALTAVTFDVATSPPDREAAYRLRNHVAVQEGWIAPDAFPDGIEHDDYDEDAVQIIGHSDGEIVATGRLVLPSAHRPLPVEEFFGIEIAPRGAVVEVGRQSIAPEHRRQDHLVFFGLLATAWLECRSRGFDVLAGVASPEMLERYDEMGFNMAVLGPAKLHWGEMRHPIRFDAADNTSGLRASYESLKDGAAPAVPGRP